MSEVLSTEGLPVAERPAYWHDVVCQTFVPLQVQLGRQARFSGSVVTDRFGEMQVSVVDAEAQQVRRTPRLIAASAREYMLVGLETKGEGVVVQDGREALLHPGEIAFYDTTRPYLLGFRDAFQMQVFQIPRDAFGLPESSLHRITGVTVRGDTGLGALVVPFLSRLAGQARSYGGPGAERLGATAVDLLAALIVHQLGQEATGEPTTPALLARVHAHIDRHLAHPELSPESIARAHHISVRYLHRLFQAEGTTVGGWIRERRLAECHRELSRGPGRTAPTVAAIAHRWGFTDPAHFSRAFRARYGVSPRALRSAAGPAAPGRSAAG